MQNTRFRFSKVCHDIRVQNLKHQRTLQIDTKSFNRENFTYRCLLGGIAEALLHRNGVCSHVCKLVLLEICPEYDINYYGYVGQNCSSVIWLCLLMVF